MRTPRSINPSTHLLIARAAVAVQATGSGRRHDSGRAHTWTAGDQQWTTVLNISYSHSCNSFVEKSNAHNSDECTLITMLGGGGGGCSLETDYNTQVTCPQS